MPRGAGTEYDETKYFSKSEELAEKFNRKVNEYNYANGITHKNVHMTGTPQGVKVARDWMENASEALGIPSYDLFNTPTKESSDIDLDVGREDSAWGSLGVYAPPYKSDGMVFEVSTPNNPHLGNESYFEEGYSSPAYMGLSDEGAKRQSGYTERNPNIFFDNYTYPKDNVLGHELWHSNDVNFNEYVKDNPITKEEFDSGFTSHSDYDLLNQNLNKFGGPNGLKEFEALQRSWDRVPNQWTVNKKRKGFAGQNNDTYTKDNQMRDALTDMYMNTDNVKYGLPEESQYPLSLAMATALSSGAYDINMAQFATTPRYIEELGGQRNPHVDFKNIKYEMGNPFDYFNSPEERTARFIGPAIGTGYNNLDGFSKKDEDEQYPGIRTALGGYLKSY
jgi:hypothetical protein